LTGIGDDAAVIKSGKENLLVSTDMFLEGVHFDLSYVPLHHLGYKSVVANVSDIAAMNGIPSQITVNLGLSNRFSLEAVEVFYQGIEQACKNYKLDLIGGDTTSSHSGLVISVTILGKVDPKQVVYRGKARNNDVVCVTGDLGSAYLGLQILEREKKVFEANPDMQPQLDKYSYLVQRQLKPEARTDIGYDLRELKVLPTAMIDISDGLASDLLHICQQSGLGAKIFEENLPVDNRAMETAVELNLNPITCALNGGEDYELLFAISAGDWEKIKNHPDISSVGFMTEKKAGVHLVTPSGTLAQIQAQGWRHF